MDDRNSEFSKFLEETARGGMTLPGCILNSCFYSDYNFFLRRDKFLIVSRVSALVLFARRLGACHSIGCPRCVL